MDYRNGKIPNQEVENIKVIDHQREEIMIKDQELHEKKQKIVELENIIQEMKNESLGQIILSKEIPFQKSREETLFDEAYEKLISKLDEKPLNLVNILMKRKPQTF